MLDRIKMHAEDVVLGALRSTGPSLARELSVPISVKSNSDEQRFEKTLTGRLSFDRRVSPVGVSW